MADWKVRSLFRSKISPPGSFKTQSICRELNFAIKTLTLVYLIAVSVDGKLYSESYTSESHWSDSIGQVLKNEYGEEPLRVEFMVLETEDGISRCVALASSALKPWIKQNR